MYFYFLCTYTICTHVIGMYINILFTTHAKRSFGRWFDAFHMWIYPFCTVFGLYRNGIFYTRRVYTVYDLTFTSVNGVDYSLTFTYIYSIHIHSHPLDKLRIRLIPKPIPHGYKHIICMYIRSDVWFYLSTTDIGSIFYYIQIVVFRFRPRAIGRIGFSVVKKQRRIYARISRQTHWPSY